MNEKNTLHNPMKSKALLGEKESLRNDKPLQYRKLLSDERGLILFLRTPNGNTNQIDLSFDATETDLQHVVHQLWGINTAVTFSYAGTPIKSGEILADAGVSNEAGIDISYANKLREISQIATLQNGLDEKSFQVLSSIPNCDYCDKFRDAHYELLYRYTTMTDESNLAELKSIQQSEPKNIMCLYSFSIYPGEINGLFGSEGIYVDGFDVLHLHYEPLLKIGLKYENNARTLKWFTNHPGGDVQARVSTPQDLDRIILKGTLKFEIFQVTFLN